MNCPGSVTLLKSLQIEEESDDPSYRREGTAMHEVAEKCLRLNTDAWEYVGDIHEEITFDQPMADAVQTYVDYCRRFMQDQYWIEAKLSSPKTHPDMFGTVDFAALVAGTHLRVVDLKGGIGILVDPDGNPQMMYYAFMLIDQHPEWPDDLPVILTIAQPRGFHEDGPIREWTTTAGAIRAWVKEALVPAMQAAAFDQSLDAGPWCRFCPAKLVCPLLTGLFKAAATCDPQENVVCDDATLARNYTQLEAVQFYIKALKDEALRRALKGRKYPEGTIKMVQKKADRVMPEEAQAYLAWAMGPEAFSPAKIKTPAQLETVSPAAKTFIAENAYQPNTGYTIALASDRKPEVTVRSLADNYGHLAKQED